LINDSLIEWTSSLSNSKTFFCKDAHIPLGVALCPISGEHKPMKGITACWLIHHTKGHVGASQLQLLSEWFTSSMTE